MNWSVASSLARLEAMVLTQRAPKSRTPGIGPPQPRQGMLTFRQEAAQSPWVTGPNHM